ncbi:MAG: hypothetical protein Kow00105_08630 [Phycisphaeraceae bacterium]
MIGLKQMHQTVTRLLASPVGIILAAVTVIAATAQPVHAADPVIRRVYGISEGARINGKVNISALVINEPEQVVFSLSGPITRTSVRNEAPYIFLRNKKGGIRYWNTSKAPEGDYEMQIRAMKDGRVTDSVTVRFVVDHSVIRQDRLPKNERERTPWLSPDTTTGNSDTTTSSSQIQIGFNPDAIDIYERGSGDNIPVTVSGQLPSNADILAIAWDHDRQQIVNSFAHVLDRNAPIITSDKLELLPDGRMQIQLLYREDNAVQYKKLHDVKVMGSGDSVDLVEETPVTSDAPRIAEVLGIRNGDTVTGKLAVEVSTSGDQPELVLFNIDGPVKITYIEKYAPYILFGDGNSWDTTKHPNGNYRMTITTMLDGEQTDTRTISFTVSNVVTTPDPVVAFHPSTPDTYRQGEGIDIPYIVNGQMPDNATVLVLAWSANTWGMVDSFAHYMDQGPWVISADKLDLLPPGRTQLQLLYRHNNKTVYKRTHDLEILPPYDTTAEDPLADGGSDTGENATPVDSTQNTGTDTPVQNEPVVDSGSNTGSTGSMNGNDGTSADTGSGSDTTTDTGNTPPPETVVNADQSPILGMNLSFVTYWTREWVFTNVLRQSRGWLSTNTGGNPWDNGDTVETDANGWPLLKPGQAAVTYMLNGMDGHYPGGTYICTYEGKGDIVFGWDAKIVSKEPGRIVVHVNPSNNGIYLRIENTDPADYIRNVKLVHEDLLDHPSSFHPLFVERLRPFKTLRFMDWQRTNTTYQRQWSDRITPDYYTMGERGGVAIELMIELCNELGADPWFCMPAQADDDYVRRFAQMVKDRLHPDAKVYVEWSNEVWNTQFEVHKWIKSVTDNQSLSPTFFDKWAAEAKRDFDIWTEVWGDQSHRVVRVAAGQAALSWGTGQLLKRLDGKFDAVSCSTYFGIPHKVEKTLTSSTTADEIIAMLEAYIVTDNRRFYREHADLARQYSEQLGRPIKLVAYEGGQHLADGGLNKPHKAALIAAQDHPKMYDLYLQNMLEFERAGGSANVLFNYVGRRDQWGSWGHLRYQDQPTEESLKFKAVLDYPKSQTRLQLTTFD